LVVDFLTPNFLTILAPAELTFNVTPIIRQLIMFVPLKAQTVLGAVRPFGERSQK